MSSEATVGLYLAFAAGILALIGMLVLQIVVSYLRRRRRERRSVVSYLRRREKERRSTGLTSRGTKAAAGWVLGDPSRAYQEESARRQSRTGSVDPKARTAELGQEQLEEAHRSV